MRCKTALGVRDERIPSASLLDGQKGLVRIRRTRTMQPLSRPTLVVINRGQQVIAGDVIEKNGSCLSAPL